MSTIDDLRRDPILRNYVKYFVALKRDPAIFEREAKEFYKDVNPRDLPVIWLCDESGHHVDKFLVMVQKYEESLCSLRCRRELPSNFCPIQRVGEGIDHIFGNFLEVDPNDYYSYREKYENWKKSTKKGLMKKIDYILNNPFRNVNHLLDFKYKSFMRTNRQKLVDFDNRVSARWMAEFEVETEAAW